MPLPNKTSNGNRPATNPPPAPPAAANRPGAARHSANTKMSGKVVRLVIGAALTVALVIAGTAFFGGDGAAWGAGVGAFLTFMILQKSVPGIGWKMAAFTMCHPAGFFFAASFMSTVVSSPFTWVFNRIPGHQTQGLGIILILLGYAGMIIEGLRKGPDAYATWAGAILPCLSGAIGGSFGTWLLHYGKDLRDYITAHTVPTFGEVSVFALALLFFVPMLYFRHCYYQSVNPGNGRTRRLYRWVRSYMH